MLYKYPQSLGKMWEKLDWEKALGMFQVSGLIIIFSLNAFTTIFYLSVEKIGRILPIL